MINNFEDITFELTDEEKEVLPVFRSYMETYHVGKRSAVTNPEICEMLKKFDGKSWTGARVRKLINDARCTGFIKNLVATSNGYYIATCHQEVVEYVESLRGRVNAIVEVMKSLESQAKESFIEIQGTLF